MAIFIPLLIRIDNKNIILFLMYLGSDPIFYSKKIIANQSTQVVYFQFQSFLLIDPLVLA